MEKTKKICLLASLLTMTLITGNSSCNDNIISALPSSVSGSTTGRFNVSDVVTPGIVASEEDSTADFPETFDLRDYGLITPICEQGDYGTCWAICAMESLETQILKNRYEDKIDLSEWHLAYFTFSGNDVFYPSHQNVFKCGGTNTIAAAILSRWIGATYEENAPYASSFTIDNSLKYTSDYKVQDIYNLHPWVSKHNKYSVSFLKELIMDLNSISVFYNSSNAYYNTSTASHYCPDPKAGVSHAVSLIGWDDNYPRENFGSKYQPQNDGAWLVKNSWGEDWGDEGYFWISYEDQSLCEAACYFCEPGHIYKTNYYDDNMGWITSVGADTQQKSTTGYMANIFTATTDDDITAISFYTTEPDAQYEVSVYTNVLGSKMPDRGTLAVTASGTEKYAGYHTIKLDKPASVSKGSKFSVVVKITNPTSPYMIATEASIIYIEDQTGTVIPNLVYMPSSNEQNKSFISADGINWNDIAGDTYTYKYPEYLNFANAMSGFQYLTLGNVCIKAFGSEVIRGDVNSDGKIDIFDLLIMQEIMTGTYSENEIPLYKKDMNTDENINIADFIKLKSILTN